MDSIPPSIPGIYKITCTATGKIYIGSAKNLRMRWGQHWAGLTVNTHENAHLQNAWNKHGSIAFVFEVLELVMFPEYLVEREQHYIDSLRPYIRSIGFNMTRAAGSTLGRVCDPQTRQKIGAKARLRSPSAETREKLRKAMQGRQFTPEHRKKIAESNHRRTLSQETRQKISAAKKGRKLSDEHRQKISEAGKGRRNSPEAIERVAAQNRGRKQSDEARQHMSEAQRNRTPEHRQRLSEAQRRRDPATFFPLAEAMRQRQIEEAATHDVSLINPND